MASGSRTTAAGLDAFNGGLLGGKFCCKIMQNNRAAGYGAKVRTYVTWP